MLIPDAQLKFITRTSSFGLARETNQDNKLIGMTYTQLKIAFVNTKQSGS